MASKKVMDRATKKALVDLAVGPNCISCDLSLLPADVAAAHAYDFLIIRNAAAAEMTRRVLSGGTIRVPQLF
jgi:hypothetical protein